MKSEAFSIDEAARGANPYCGHESHNNNCQCCVWAYEMRRRGFDVIAKPQQKKYDQQDEIRRLVVGGKWVTVSASNIDQVMKRWGIGSRAILYLAWVKDHAHVINQECTKNGVVYVDPQPGMIVDGPRYLNRARNMRLMRVDDKPVTDAISQVVEEPPEVMPEWVPRMVMYHT